MCHDFKVRYYEEKTCVALFANDVTHYRDYATGSHRGAIRTNYSLKWSLVIGMRCRC